MENPKQRYYENVAKSWDIKNYWKVAIRYISLLATFQYINQKFYEGHASKN